MRLKGRQVLLMTLCLAATLGSFSLLASAQSVAATDWLAPTTPTLSKVVDLPANIQPPLINVDCDYHVADGGVFCSSDTSIGSLSMSSSLLVDGRQYPILNNIGKLGIQPLPNTDYIISRYDRPNYGTYIGVYRSLSRSDLVKQMVNGQVKYQVTKTPDFFLSYNTCGVDGNCSEERLIVNTGFLAISKNGVWMVLQTPEGLVRINTTTMTVKPFGPRQEASWYGGQASGQVAISNDGRYVVINTIFNGTLAPTSMNIYDLSTCDITYDDLLADSKAYCQHHDVWNGYHQTNVNSNDLGVKQYVNNPYFLGSVRFVDDNNISFSLMYDKDGSSYKVATYVMAAAGVQTHKIGLLGMGDSYISGEGEQNYIKGTDNRPNLCHQSSLSYPFLLGATYFDSYESVACSGAKTDDVVNQSSVYEGQAKDGVTQGDRDSESLLRSFKPGYKYQNMFVENYTPQAALLSIGGNNPSNASIVGANFPGFANVVSTCVLSTENTCYASAGDRYQLLKGVYSLFDELVRTYEKVKNASPTTRVYVVGYPQVIKPNGDCGLNVHLNNNEALFAQQLIEHLDKTIELAAKKSGVLYVDTQSAFAGQRLCEGGALAMNGLTAGHDNFGVIGKESYHPTVIGHNMLADTIAQKTAHLTVPNPAPNPNITAPTINPADPFLIDPVQQQYDEYIHKNDPDLAPDILFRRENTSITVDGLSSGTQLNGTYRVVLHSDPVEIGYVHADENGDISTNVSIPSGVPAGLHTLHLFGKNFDGHNLDISKQVYVAASSQDYDGDGVPNDQEPCVIFAASGQDVDKDGIDDACDPVISDAPATTTTNSSTSHGQSSEQNNSDTQAFGLASSSSSPVKQQTDSATTLQPAGPSERQPQVQGAATINDTTNLLEQAAPKQSSTQHSKIVIAIIFTGLALVLTATQKFRRRAFKGQVS